MSTAPAIDLHSRSIFELTDEELQERLRPTYEAMKAANFAKGGILPILMRNSAQPHPMRFMSTATGRR